MEPGGYRRSNAFWNSYFIADLVEAADEPAKTKLREQTSRIKAVIIVFPTAISRANRQQHPFELTVRKATPWKPRKISPVLIEIMEALRHPETGCPWDIVQTFETIKPYTIEEAYEVADAIERDDRDDLCEELGDLLLQVVFHSRIAQEMGAFSFEDVVHAVTSK